VSVVETFKSPNGFLREFHFSTLAQAVIDDLLGSVKRQPWMKFTATAARDMVEARFLFTMTVKLEVHQRRVEHDRHVRMVGLKHGRKFVLDFSVPDSVVVEFRKRVPEMFATWLREGLLGSAHKFYEADPRIGWRWGDPRRDKLPVSKLFDPPERFSRTGLPVPSVLPMEEAIPLAETPHCAFCRKAHRFEDPPIWAGANLMWIHRTCWRAPS
jgi:hypothetical protein